MKPIFTLTLSAILLCANQVLAHPGRTDGQGCHTNRQTGEYHCHNSGTNTPSKPQPSNLSSAQIVSVGDGGTRFEPKCKGRQLLSVWAALMLRKWLNVLLEYKLETDFSKYYHPGKRFKCDRLSAIAMVALFRNCS